jgi:3-dehydroquinate synthase
MVNVQAEVFISERLFKEVGFFLPHTHSSCFVLVDENTLQHCYPLISKTLPPHQVIEIPSGEANKTINSCQLIWTKLTEARAGRKALCLNLGGGVIGDMGGFAAACYKRGIPFINIPTTLLAMVDASVGGKTGIDFMGFKNQVGLFSQPEAVFVYTDFLATLPQRELTSGFAEVIKHYLIADKDAFEDVYRSSLNIRDYNWPHVVKKNVGIKLNIVEQDPEESGIRKALNFGHTIGHAIESCFLPNEKNYLLHGEAIAAGIITESYISLKKGFLATEEQTKINEVILKYFKLPPIEVTAHAEILKLVKQDKKNENDVTQFTLLNGTGNYCINNTVEEELIKESLNYYNSLLE